MDFFGRNNDVTNDDEPNATDEDDDDDEEGEVGDDDDDDKDVEGGGGTVDETEADDATRMGAVPILLLLSHITNRTEQVGHQKSKKQRIFISFLPTTYNSLLRLKSCVFCVLRSVQSNLLWDNSLQMATLGTYVHSARADATMHRHNCTQQDGLLKYGLAKLIPCTKLK
jgi:hypothetical protein